MATSARVTGVVLSADHRRGTSARTGNDYDFRTATVLVGTYGTVDVRVSNLAVIGGQQLEKGAQVDWAVELDVYNGNISVNAAGVWDSASVVELV
jgi:hypothetical protein